MVKTIKKQKGKRSLSKKRKSKNIQKGGVSNACVLPFAKTNMSYRGSGVANLHNLNPQASLDLDNQFMSYGGPIPLDQSGGNSKCGDEGVGTNTYKSETFKEYLNNLDNQLSFKGGNQKGSGYTVDPDEFVAGMPVYKGYDDNSPPAIIDGKLIMAGGEGSICGNGAIKRRGSRKSRKSQKSRKSKKSKKSRKSKNSNKQIGGEFLSIGSKPAEFATAFDGPKGVFKYPDDMKERDFGEYQPNYSVNAI